MSDTCIVVFSYTDTPEKEELLQFNLEYLMLTNRPIVLVTHSTVTKRIQDCVDYVIYEKENLIFDESQLLNEFLPLYEYNYNTQFIFNKITTRSYVQKSTYQPAVINMYINAVNFVKTLGFKYMMLWEYDRSLDGCLDKIGSIIKKVEDENRDGFFIPCSIAGIPSIHSVPQIFEVNSFSKYCPARKISTPKEFIESTSMMFCEEWIYKYFLSLNNPLVMEYEEYLKNFSDCHKNMVESEHDNPNYNHINSGIFVNRETDNLMYSVFNYSKFEILVDVSIESQGKSILDRSLKLGNLGWFCNYFDEQLTADVRSGEIEIKISEKFTFNGNSKIYNSVLNQRNFESTKKAKVYYFLDQ